MKEQEFVARCEKVHNQLYRVAFCYLGNESDCLEVIDESIYQALKHLKKLKEEDFFETWLTRIVINGCNKELKRRSKVLFGDIPEKSQEFYDNLPLKEALEKLPNHLRNVIVIRFYMDKTLKETAELLEIPQGTVVTHQRKALALLRLELEEE
ncbi:MAG: sigma-70 family RNA polymerase sigma factor [Eubacteriales bacterium]